MSSLSRDTDSVPAALPSPEDCFLGGGNMGVLMRSTDWRETVLGRVAEWPQSLRTALVDVLNRLLPSERA